MKLGDNADLQRLARQSGGGGPNREDERRRERDRDRGGGPPAGRGGGGGRDSGRESDPTRLPDELVFSTFYDEDPARRLRLYFEAPSGLSELLHRCRDPRLTSTALRSLFNAFALFARRLERDPCYWPTAQDRFGHFYATAVVRQAERRVIPPLLKDLIDRHRELALASPAEMIGLFKYVMYLLCYYGDKEERRD